VLNILVSDIRTYSLITGYDSPFYHGSAVTYFSPQEATTTFPSPVPPPFVTHSPVPTLFRGCKSLPVIDQALVTHLSYLASSLSPELHTAPITPIDQPYAQPQVIYNTDDLGFGFPTAAGSISLPMVHPSPPYIPSYQERELTPLRYLIRHRYSPYPVVWGECPQSDPLRPDIPPFHSVTVSRSIVVIGIVRLRDFAGYHPT